MIWPSLSQRPSIADCIEPPSNLRGKQIANRQFPKKPSDKCGIESAQKHAPIWRAARKRVPENSAHSRLQSSDALFLRHHSPQPAPRKPMRPDLTRDPEHQSADGIIARDFLAHRPLVFPETCFLECHEDH